MRKRKNRSRGWKAARNFLLLGLALFGCWAGIRSPLWMMEYELRKDAQEEFEILWQGSLSGGVYGGAMGTKPMLVARVDGYLRGVTLNEYEGYLWFYGPGKAFPITSGTTMVVSSRELVDFITSYNGGTHLLAVELPDEAVMGEITIQTQDGSRYTSAGKREMDVIWFPLQLNTAQTYNHLVNADYTLNLYDDDGTLLSQTTGLLHRQEEADA